MNKPVEKIKGITNFTNAGMNPDPRSGISKIEHFLVEKNLRPFHALVASDNTVGGTTPNARLKKATKGNGKLYAIGVDPASSPTPYLFEWNTSTFQWNGAGTFGSSGSAADVVHYYSTADKIYGLWKGTHLWQMTTTGTFNGTYQALTYTYYADMITHSLDGIMYIATDNKISKLDNTTFTSGALTLPTNFRITSISEQGIYLNIVGYDVNSGVSTSYQWDRDSSLTTLSQKYNLGSSIAVHNAELNKQMFFVCIKQNSSQTPFDERPVMKIKYISGDRILTKDEFSFQSLTLLGGGKWIEDDKLYFTALVKFDGDSASKNVVFCLDYLGNLTIAQNAAINTSSSVSAGVIRDGDGFWIFGGSDGSWHSTTTYSTESSIETKKESSENYGERIELVGMTIMSDALPSGANITVYARTDSTDTWSTLYTFSTQSSIRNVFTLRELTTALQPAKELQFKIVSTGGAVINSWQYKLRYLPVEKYS